VRSPRILVAVLALAMTASLPFAPSPASARVDSRPAVGLHQSDVSQRAAVTITAKVVKRRVKPNRPKQLVFQGTVTPAKGPVYIQKATRCSKAERTCNFRFYKKVFLKNGAYQAVIGAPPTQRSWLWRAKVGTSYSKIWQTCTKRPLQDCNIPY
jgi:hypothetical protein